MLVQSATDDLRHLMPNAPLNRTSYPLTRTYTVASLVGIALVTLALAVFYRANATEELRRQETAANAAIATALANTVWEEFGDFVADAGALPAEELRRHPRNIRLGETLKGMVDGLRVVKIKIYDLQGVTVFSSDSGQIGERKSDNPGFLAALRGETVSDLIYRNQFNAFDGVIEDRSLLFSYIPVRIGESGEVVAVFELYSDLTPLLLAIDRAEFTVVLVVVSLMLVLFVFLLLIVRRAELLIRRHEASENELKDERIRYLADHDQLTGLPNRSMLLKLLASAIDRLRRAGREQLTLVLLDIDRFKLVNDHLGQQAGDKLLLDVVMRIRQVAGEQRIVARVGSDQFVLLLEGMEPGSVEALVSRLIHSTTRPYALDGEETKITASLGVAFLDADVSDAGQLLKHAEAALQQAKNAGRNRHAHFTADMNARAAERFELEAALHQAVDRKEFAVHFQPRIDTVSGRVLGAEALLRWERPHGRRPGPDEFVPVLEDMGLIETVGAWVLTEACSCCRAWHGAGFDGLKVSVNLSMRQFQSERLLADVIQALLDSRLPAESLELELTESILADDTHTAVQVMGALKSLGVALSIDDFGTGYSSLSYLMNYPVDYLKIDRAFVRDATTNPGHATLTRTIITMARSLNLGTVAEGVEKPEQHALLAGLGCDELQGFLFSPPLPADRFLAYLRHDPRAAGGDGAAR